MWDELRQAVKRIVPDCDPAMLELDANQLIGPETKQGLRFHVREICAADKRDAHVYNEQTLIGQLSLVRAGGGHCRRGK